MEGVTTTATAITIVTARTVHRFATVVVLVPVTVTVSISVPVFRVATGAAVEPAQVTK